jgi:hypothetical protein
MERLFQIKTGSVLISFFNIQEFVYLTKDNIKREIEKSLKILLKLILNKKNQNPLNNASRNENYYFLIV